MLPMLADDADAVRDRAPGLVTDRGCHTFGEIDAVHQLVIYVELSLTVRNVADANGLAPP